MSERDNAPKPLPDDFGMTMPGIRPNKQPQNQDNLDFTVPNLRLPSQAQQPPSNPPDDFGMTIPNINRGSAPRSNTPRELPPDDFDLTAPNMRREVPSDADFGLTMPGTGGYGYNSQSRNSEPDFGATMPYIKLPEQERRRYEETQIPPPAQPKTEEKRKSAVPLWLWIASGSLVFFAFLLISGVLAWYFFFRTTGFVLVVRNAPVGSIVTVDDKTCGERGPDGAMRCYGLEGGNRRTVKTTHNQYTDDVQVIDTEDGVEKEVFVNMRPKEVLTPPNECDDPDPRVAQAECGALDELDKLKPPYSADELVRVMNLQIINFESNKYDIPEKRKRFLRRAAEKINQLPASTVIEVGGHTDTDGTDQSNIKLSQNRAEAVKLFLSGAGVSESMLTINGYGETQPVAENTTDEGKFKNRRIHYKVVQR